MSMRKIFIITIALSMLLCFAIASPIISQTNQSSVVPHGYKTKIVPKNIPDLQLYQMTWLVEETIHLRSLIIYERAFLKAPEGKYLTLTVNGVGRPIQPGTYKGDVILSVTDDYYMTPHGNSVASDTGRNLHTAILIDNGKVVSEKSIPAIVQGGKVTDTKAEGIYIGSKEESFNGIVIAGNSEYTINNARIELDGFSDNDFLGVGTGVTTIDKAKVTINDSIFDINGVTRCSVHVGGDSVVTLNNCKLYNHSPDTDWIGFFCWQIGFHGNTRLTQLCDNGTVYYNNCYLKTNGWAINSIDGGNNVKMYVKDSTLELSGPGANGYGAFCIGTKIEVVFDHSKVDVSGYPMIVMGTEARPSIINGSVITGRRFGAFIVGDKSSVFTIKDSSFETDKSTLCIKGSATTFNIDNAVMKPKNGTIVQLQDSEEAGMTAWDYKVPVGVVDKAMPGRDLSTASPADDIIMNISNSKFQGNFFNSTTNIHAEKNSIQGGWGKFCDTLGSGASREQSAATDAPNPAMAGGMPMGEQKDMHGPKNLSLNLTKAKVEGIISSATEAHREGVTVINEDNRDELSNITQTPAEAINNGVIISLDKDSEWVVTGVSYITSLTIAQGAQVKAPQGKTLTMTVDGVKKTIAAGTYKGKIKMAVN